MPFGLWNRKAATTVDRQKQVDINYAIRQLEQGNLSFILKDNIRLDSGGGFVILTVHDVSLLESGLARAIGQAEADRGTMTVTLDGIAFAGQQAGRHNISVGFGDVESVGHDRDGISIAARGRAQKLHFGGFGRTTVPLKVKDREYVQPLSGKVVRLVIEGVMKISLEGEGGQETSQCSSF